MSTIPSTLAPIITSFTPEKQSASFSSIINQYFSPVTYSNAGANTLLTSDVLGGLITHTAAAAHTDTLPTATLMAQAIENAKGSVPGAPAAAVGVAGSGILFFVTAGGAGAITIAVGAGGTLVSLGGSAVVAAGTTTQFLLVITKTDAPGFVGATYTLYAL